MHHVVSNHGRVNASFPNVCMRVNVVVLYSLEWRLVNGTDDQIRVRVNGADDQMSVRVNGEDARSVSLL